jgi:hypothetical protein
MASNAEEYLKGLDGKVVVAVIGYAHLAGMTAQLATRGISPIGVSLSGNSETAYWETKAWSGRHKKYPQIFSAHKERSRFLDQTWAQQTAAAVSFMDRLDPKTDMQVLNDEHVAHVGKYLEDQRAVFGEQVVLHEPAIRAGEVLEVWDRAKARSLVAELNVEGTEFAYAFLNRPSDRAYTVVTRGNTQQTLKEYMEAKPAPATRYAVLFHEPDLQPQSGIEVSAVWDALRPANAGGSGKPPGPVAGRIVGPGGDPRDKKSPSKKDAAAAAGNNGAGKPPGQGPWYQAEFWDDEKGGSGGDRTGLLRTLDPRRAAINIAALQRQKRLDPKEIKVLDQLSSIAQISFTPRDGEAAGLVVLVARNELEFRHAVQLAAEAKKFQNKQVALITCGDAFSDATALRETVLGAGALMVWIPNRQISESAGNRLAAEVKQIAAAAANAGGSFRDIDQLMNRAVGSLRRAEPANAEFMPLTHSGSFVLLETSDITLGSPS